MKLSGTIVDVERGEIFPGTITVANGLIAAVERGAGSEERLILPGFVDAHVHVESSMLPPSEFARLAVIHGTVGTVSDPHEIGNVLGAEGVEWMIKNGETVPFKFAFGAPSCVPATTFETAGAVIDSAGVAALLARPDVRYLAEMMNFPGVLHGDGEVHAKLASARALGKPIDGHAPGLRGDDAARYASFGISTDHECFTEAEAREKISLGMKILIREGSAAKNFEALIPLLPEFPDSIMFCSDDKHPNDLIVGHIDQLCRRALRRGIDPITVFRAASRNPVRHYGLAVGLLQPGDPADFLIADSLEDLTIHETYIDGVLVASDGRSLLPRVPVKPVNRFVASPLTVDDVRCPARGSTVRTIEVLPGQLITGEKLVPATIVDGAAVSDPGRNLLKVVVVNRYVRAPAAIGFVTNIGLQAGALASSVAHDCHNIVAAGVSDEDLVAAVNLVIEAKGGVAAAQGRVRKVVPLPIGGLMSDLDGYEVAEEYEAVDRLAKEWGSELPAPFMTLSFLALLVIPNLKLSDLGLFDGGRFSFVDLWAQ